MQSIALRVTHGWLNDANDYCVSRYLFKFDQVDKQKWRLQVMVEAEEWVGIDLPILPRVVDVHYLHVYGNIADNRLEVDFADHQYQYQCTISRHLLTIEKFNKGDFTKQVWYIANLINVSVDIG